MAENGFHLFNKAPFFCVQGLKLSILIKLIINVDRELCCYRLELRGGGGLLQPLLVLLCFLYPYLHAFISHNVHLAEGALLCLIILVAGEKIYIHVVDSPP